MIKSTPKSVIPIFIIDDHQIVLDGIKKWFRTVRDQIEIAGTALDIPSVERKGIPDRVKIIVMDLFIGFTDPFINYQFLKTHYPDKPIVIYSHEEDNSWKAKMYELGASAYIPKTATRSDFKFIIKVVARGEKFISLKPPDEINAFGPAALLPEMIPDYLGLTDSEKELICRMSRGQHAKDISDETKLPVPYINLTFFKLRKRFKFVSNTQLILAIFKASYPRFSQV